MISNSRVKLRAIEETDANHYYNWINDPITNHWRGLHHPLSSTEALADLKKLKITSSSEISLTILTNEEKPIGLVGLRSICSRSRRAEIWIYIGDKNYWNQKFGQEVISTLVRYAFEEMNLHRIWLECDSNFMSAIKCYEKVGFIREGQLKDGYFRHGKFHDTTIMGIINKQG